MRKKILRQEMIDKRHEKKILRQEMIDKRHEKKNIRSKYFFHIFKILFSLVSSLTSLVSLHPTT